MGFVNCLMADEDREKIYFPVFTMRDGRRPTLYKWAVDVDRDAFLVVAGISGGPHADTAEECRFVLVYKNCRIVFWASNEFWKMSPSGGLDTWSVSRIDVPAEVGEAEAKSIIEDALRSYGSGWNGQMVKVGVEFCWLQGRRDPE